MTAELLNVVLPIYLCVGLGYGWARAGRAYDVPLITDLIMTFGAPCLVFSSLTELPIDREAMVEFVVATLLVYGLTAAAATAILRGLRLPAHTFLSPLVFMNAGNMGLPVCLFAFGDDGLSLAVTFFALGALLHFTAGVAVWTGTARASEVLRTPLAWAAALALLVVVSDVSVPRWLGRTTSLLGGITIPLMQFTLGVSLGRLGLGRRPRTLGLAVLRLGLGLAVGVLVAWLLGLTGTSRGVLIVDSAMPVAVFNYMLAQRYERSPAEVAALVVVSTLLSFATLPLLLAWLL